MDKIRLLLADDHTVLRTGLRMLLNAQSDMEVVGEAADGAEAVKRTLELRPDVVLMDISMGSMNGLTATRQIRTRLPQVKVLVLTMHDDEEYLKQVLEAGATGYLLKAAADTELVVAIRAVNRGEVYLYPSFTKVLLDDLKWKRGGEVDSPQDSYGLLSQREREILQMVALGYTNQQIGDRLFLSIKTVETYRARLMAKLNLRSRADLVRYALQKGLLGEALGKEPTDT
jgi:two-component system response regulator NreC